jgi:serine/threonine protein kinase
MPEADVEARARARVGQTLNGKYRLDRLLGIGGMATVYAATHRNKKRVAVKMLHPELSMHTGLRTRFMREGYVANTVEHPGAVAVLDDDVAEDGSAFLVMELLEGATLDELCERQSGRLPLRQVLAVAERLLDVLAAADTKHIVHRDIKPSNVMVTRDGQVKVLDFGVARLRDVDSAHATHSGMALGTPAFMAPEQALGRSEEISGRTDVWAVGATMVALLTGHAVHEASTAQEQMVFAATRPAPSLATLYAEAPPQVVALVDRALAFAQADRWPSAAEMRDAVREATRAVFEDAPSSLASLASLASAVSAAAQVAPTMMADSPSDPLAPTLAAPSTPGSASGSGARSPQPAVSPIATSLVGTTTHPHAAPAARGRLLVAASVLVLAGAAGGAWVATRGRAPASPAPPSLVASSVVAVAPPVASASASATAPALDPPSAAAEPSAPPPTSAAPRPRPSRPAPASAPAPTKPASDRFDRQ